MSIWDNLFEGVSDFFDPDEIDKIEADAAQSIAEHEAMLDRIDEDAQRQIREIDRRMEETNRRFEERRIAIRDEYDTEITRIDDEYNLEMERINARSERVREFFVPVEANQFSSTGVNWKKEGF